MNGSNGSSKMIELLERIALGVENTNVRLDGLEQKVEVTNQRLDVVIEHVGPLEHKADITNQRLENILDFAGGRHADHERRISALEDSVFKKSG